MTGLIVLRPNKFLSMLALTLAHDLRTLPVQGTVEIIEPHLKQRECLMWRTITIDNEWAHSPLDSYRVLMAHPSMIEGTDEEWLDLLMATTNALTKQQEMAKASAHNPGGER
jgi:hypothetical protein